MRFEFDDGRGRGFDHSPAAVFRESADRLTAAVGEPPARARVGQTFYEHLAAEVESLPSLDDAIEMTAAGRPVRYLGIEIVIDE